MASLLMLGWALLTAPAHAWDSSAKWGGRVVGYQVNPQNLDVTDLATATLSGFTGIDQVASGMTVSSMGPSSPVASGRGASAPASAPESGPVPASTAASPVP